MKQRLKRLLVHLLSLLPGKPVILLESAPPLGDNTGALYRELLAQGWNDRYRLIWVVPDPAAFRDVHEKNVGFVGTHGKWALMRLFALRARAAAIVDCNGQIQTLRPETVHLYLTHGSPLKSVHDYYFCDPTTDWALSQAPFFDAVNSYEFHIPQDKLVTLGFPRKPDILHPDAKERDLFMQTRVRVSIVHAHSCGIDLLLDGIHRAKGGKDRLGRGAEFVCQRFCGQTVDALCPHDAHRCLDHFFFRKFVLRSHCLYPFSMK